MLVAVRCLMDSKGCWLAAVGLMARLLALVWAAGWLRSGLLSLDCQAGCWLARWLLSGLLAGCCPGCPLDCCLAAVWATVWHLGWLLSGCCPGCWLAAVWLLPGLLAGSLAPVWALGWAAAWPLAGLPADVEDTWSVDGNVLRSGPTSQPSTRMMQPASSNLEAACRKQLKDLKDQGCRN